MRLFMQYGEQFGVSTLLHYVLNQLRLYRFNTTRGLTIVNENAHHRRQLCKLSETFKNCHL